MLAKLTENSVFFNEFVEHPGGADCGPFTQCHTYGVDDEGNAYYSADPPYDNCDAFVDVPIGDLMWHLPGRRAKKVWLKEIKEKLHEQFVLVGLEPPVALLAKLDEAKSLVVFFDNKPVKTRQLETTCYRWGWGQENK